MGDTQTDRGRTDNGMNAVLSVLLVAGFLGAGKTRIARALTGSAGAGVADDVPFRDRIAGTCPTDAGAVLSVVEASPFLVPGAGVAGQVTVTVIDAVNVVANLDDADFGDLVARQIRAADLLVLTCGDVADPGPARHAIAAMTDVPVIEAHAEADIAQAILARVTRIESALRPAGAGAPQDHRAAFTIWTYSGSAVLTKDTLTAFLTGRPAGAYRIRGDVRLQDGGGRIDIFGRGRRTSLIERPAETTLAVAGPAKRLLAREMDLAFAEAVAAAAYSRGMIACR